MNVVILIASLVGCAGSSSAGATGPEEPQPALEIRAPHQSIAVGESMQLEALIRGSSSHVQPASKVEWLVSNPTVAEIDSTGVVTGQVPGNFDVIASSGSRRGKRKLSVVDPPVEAPPNEVPPLLPAFPGAEGFGATALSDCRSRPLQVIEVTNLNDDGMGSFRDAVLNQTTDTTYNIIIFRTGGNINLVTPIIIQNKTCIYIAGQTAPGDGIQIVKNGKGIDWGSVGTRGGVVDNAQTDIVVRYLAVRSDASPGNQVSFSIRQCHRCVIDHMSFTTDDQLDPGNNRRPGDTIADVTWSRNIIGPSFGTGWLAASTPDVDGKIRRMTLHHNFIAFAHHRMPRWNIGEPNPVATDGIQQISNIIYHTASASRVNEIQGGVKIDIINNLYVSKSSRNVPRGYRPINVSVCATGPNQGTCAPADSQPPPSLYLSGNRYRGGATFDRATDEDYEFAAVADGTPIPLAWRRTGPLAATMPWPVTITSPLDTDAVLADVGASGGLACDGTWMDRRDALDRTLISHFHNLSGPTATMDVTLADYGGLPTHSPGTRCLDTDRDGMPDEYEVRYAFDPNNANDNRGDADGDGYLNLEEYLNGTPPR